MQPYIFGRVGRFFILKSCAANGGCDHVGFLGATLGGGHGRLQGLHGLMIDNLLSAQLTIATGETITVSNTSNPELFWGLRGAGQNFGIITEATYRIYDATNGGVQFVADIVYEATLLPEVFKALNSFVVPAETTILTMLFVDPVAMVVGVLFPYNQLGVHEVS